MNSAAYKLKNLFGITNPSQAQIDYFNQHGTLLPAGSKTAAPNTGNQAYNNFMNDQMWNPVTAVKDFGTNFSTGWNTMFR
jgi:hypothetical protein